MQNVLISTEMGEGGVGTILGHPQLNECMGICVLHLTPGSELRASDNYQRLVKTLSETFSVNSARVCALGWLLLGTFSGFFGKKNV